jgi:ABC-type branched-subunit amino acid transport system substrate-binding protein
LLWVAIALAASMAACGGKENRPNMPPATPLTASGCSSVTYGGEGRPDVLIAGILALQGPFFDHGVQDSQSLKLVLDERRWRAGEYRVGLQICDETTATSETADPATCRRHARDFARNRSIIVAVGPVMSGCAREMLPILNRAPAGPLALISPSTTYLGLTRSGPGVAKGDPDGLYPTGRRGFLRLAAADDAQAAAAAMFAKQLGATRVFALDDDEPYGTSLAESFTDVARRSGMEVAGRAVWHGDEAGYRSLGQRVRSSGADAVYLGGYISNNGPKLVQDLRAVLGSDVDLLAPDGFNQPGNLVEGAGDAAEGFTVTIAVLPNRELPPGGQEFAAEFARRFSQRPCCFAVHTGELANIVLDAIEASDGTRRSVLRKLFETRVEDGLLGDFRFDRFGDTTKTTIGVYRIEDGRLKFQVGISPPSELLTRR